MQINSLQQDNPKLEYQSQISKVDHQQIGVQTDDQDFKTIQEENQLPEYKDQEIQAMIPEYDTNQKTDHYQNQQIITNQQGDSLTQIQQNNNKHITFQQRYSSPKRIDLRNQQNQLTPRNYRKRIQAYYSEPPNIDKLRSSYNPLTLEEMKMQRKIGNVIDIQKARNQFLENCIRNQKLEELDNQSRILKEQQNLEDIFKQRKLKQQQDYKQQLDQQQRTKFSLGNNKLTQSYENAQQLFYSDSNSPKQRNLLFPEIYSKTKPKRTIFNPMTYQEKIYDKEYYPNTQRTFGNFLEKEKQTLIEKNEDQKFHKIENQNYTNRNEQSIKDKSFNQQNQNQDEIQTCYQHYQRNIFDKTNKFDPIYTGQFKIPELDAPKMPQDIRYYRGKFYSDTKQLIR